MDERLTVVHLVPQDSWRGAQVYAGRLRDELADDPEQRHFAVALFDAPVAGLRPDRVLTGRPTIRRRLGLDPLAVLRLRKLLADEGADVVVAHGGEPLKYAVAARTAAPVIYYKVGLSTAELSRRSRLAFYRFLTRRVTLGVAVSSAVHDQLRDVLGMPSAHLRIIPNARDPEVYYPAATPPGGIPRLIWIGQLEEGKQPGLFLDVIDSLQSAGLKFSADMIGDGSMRREIEGRARHVGVELLGVRDDVPSRLREASMLVTTSAPDTEGMPGVLIEAGLSGLPVVSTAAAGANDVVAAGETGFVIESAEVSDLAQTITKLLRDPELRRTMGARARGRCVAGFSIQAGAAQWRETVEGGALTNRRGGRG
ncbi:hypothetical protein N802_01125 [Knoellia sinensis KCTC 19936]|uniref:D-inositol 3-phosphate glycosyltransferase n=1 Tax=Knoellia sinensis KCTC 19936 TaxID=1385520 RepID=A0A0A0JHB6_9MICO|nr:glycosyltransferase family 4 protein [Knoellia sinensis]KGN35006.1 hypothetical protein N802_01125 [Knoellia sinensis KCTC 19936]